MCETVGRDRQHRTDTKRRKRKRSKSNSNGKNKSMSNDGGGDWVFRPAYMRESDGGCPGAWRSIPPEAQPVVPDDAAVERWRQRNKFILAFERKPATSVPMEERKSATR
jgi:hypothetical protein